MGIRIHTACGWLGPELTNPEEWIENLFENAESGEVEKFFNQDQYTYSERRVTHEPYPNYWYELVHFADHPDTEKGRLIFSVPWYTRSWYRIDDTLDYMMYLTNEKQHSENKIGFSTEPIYPYVGFMDSDTGEILKGTDQYKRNRMPIVPLSIIGMCHYLQPYGDPNFWLKLRPGTATWWS